MTYPRQLDTCPYAVYRIYDETSRLLYIGMSCDPDARLNAHRYYSDWAGQHDHHEVTWYSNRDKAAAAETEAIKSEHPEYNVAHNQPSKAQPTTRITVDLSPDDYEALNRYVAELTPEFRRLTIARTVRAMIRAAPGDYKVTAAITAQLRRDTDADRH